MSGFERKPPAVVVHVAMPFYPLSLDVIFCRLHGYTGSSWGRSADAAMLAPLVALDMLRALSTLKGGLDWSTLASSLSCACGVVAPSTTPQSVSGSGHHHPHSHHSSTMSAPSLPATAGIASTCSHMPPWLTSVGVGGGGVMSAAGLTASSSGAVPGLPLGRASLSSVPSALLTGTGGGGAVNPNVCVVHRDVKTENILVSREGFFALTDFGLAVVSDGKRRRSAGNLVTCAPEVHLDCAALHVPCPENDVWSLGVVVAMCLPPVFAQMSALSGYVVLLYNPSSCDIESRVSSAAHSRGLRASWSSVRTR